MTKEEISCTKLLETENNVLKKQNAIYHNGFMEINFLVAKDTEAEDKVLQIINLVQATRIDTAKVRPSTSVIIV